MRRLTAPACFPAGLLLGLLLASTQHSSAQELANKAAPKQLLVLGTSTPAARAALDSGTFEGRVGGYSHRADTYLRRALEQDSASGFIRAEYATYFSTLSQADRLRELDRAVLDAARAPTPELLMVVALREGVRGEEATARAVASVVRAMLPDDPNVFATSIWGLTPAQDAPLLQEYLARNPEQVCAYRHLAYSLYAAGNAAEGLQTMRKYVALLPDHPTSHQSYADLLLQSGRLEEAQREYTRALALDPDFTSTYMGLARLAQRRHDYATARAQFEAVLAHRPGPDEEVSTRRDLAFNAVFAGDDALAREQLMTAIAVSERAGQNEDAARTRAFMARLEAAAGHAEAAQRTLLSLDALPAADRAFAAALVHAALHMPAEAHLDVQTLEGSAGSTPDLIATGHVLETAGRGDLAGSQAQLGRIQPPGLRILAQAFVHRAAVVAGDATAAKVARAEIERYSEVDANSAFARGLIGRN